MRRRAPTLSEEGRWVPWEISVEIINKPDKRKRLLWDASHSLTIPPCVLAPRQPEPERRPVGLERRLTLYQFQRAVSGGCGAGATLLMYGMRILVVFHLEDYGALLIVDSEDIYSQMK